MKYHLHTDGGCHNNPGTGGWAFVVRARNKEIHRQTGAAYETTNNRMELQAVIEGLDYLQRLVADSGAKITIYTDSRYVMLGATEWINRWVANRWRASNKKPVKNQDLWQSLYSYIMKQPLKWIWVKGHSGDAINELCDWLVQKAIAEFESK